MKVSVIMSVYNIGKMEILDAAIKSILNQNFRDFELIINEFRCKVPTSIYTTILFTDTRSKINLLKTYVTE